MFYNSYYGADIEAVAKQFIILDNWDGNSTVNMNWFGPNNNTVTNATKGITAKNGFSGGYLKTPL